jgi:hypothetical protein
MWVKQHLIPLCLKAALDELRPIDLALYALRQRGFYFGQARRRVAGQFHQPRQCELDESHLVGRRPARQAEDRFALP